MTTAVAIVGIACRFPGAESVRALGALLDEGRNAVVEIPPSRWPKDAFRSIPAGLTRPRFAGLLADVTGFDAEFFGIPAPEAIAMDPQQRLVLEVTHEALCDAGIPTRSLAGSKTGVFMGLSSADYTERLFADVEYVGPFTTTGAALSVVANRLSYVFDLHGPSLVVDTACSSSLLAVLLATRSIASGEASLAIAGGVNVLLSPAVYAGFAMAQALSPDGQCRAFDADANGMVRGEGCGIVILKSLDRALADGDRIHAVLRGGATNQDGRTNGLAAPNRLGQEALLKAAYDAANVDPRHVQYVEAHGTGTPLGDPIEAFAVGHVIGAGRSAAGAPACGIGSIKTNIGHLEGAAGVAGLLKVVTALGRSSIPPSLHYRKPNPRIPFAELGLSVVAQHRAWAPGTTRIAGVSAFGFGGTNVHVVVEEPPRREPASRSAVGPQLLPLSARSPHALTQLATRLKDELPSEQDLPGLVRGAIFRRDQEPYRAWATFTQREELSRELDRIAAAAPARKPGPAPSIAFVFPGMGSQQLEMGKELLAEPAFAAAVAECSKALAPECGFSVEEAMARGAVTGSADRVQAMLFAYQYALAKLLLSWGVDAKTVIGGSVGEVAASTIAGALSLADGARVVVRRARLLVTREGHGRLCVIEATEAEARSITTTYENQVFVAAEYAPRLRLLAGEEPALAAVIADFEQKGRLARWVKGGVVGSHSPFVEPLHATLLDALQGIASTPPTRHMVSTVTGDVIEGTALDARYWWRNVREAIHFERALARALDRGVNTFIEISPQPTFTGAIRDVIADRNARAEVFALVRREGRSERSSVRDLAGALFAAGVIDLSALASATGAFVALPAHPFNHETFALDVAPRARVRGAHEHREGALLGGARGAKTSGPPPAALGKRELLALPAAAREEALVKHLRSHVADVLRRPAESLDVGEPLTHLGIGSLMGMELHAKLRRDFGVSLPPVTFLKGPSVREVARLLLEAMVAQGDGPPASQARPAIGSQTVRDYPLSRAQERLAFVHALAPKSAAYNIPVALRLAGELDVAALERAVRLLIERHDVLRATVRGTNPRMFVGPVPAQVLARTDASPAALPDMLRARAEEPFELAKGPLFRAELIRLGPTEHVLFASMHHVIADGFSLGIVIEELAEAYRAFAAQREPTLPFLPSSYGELATREREQPLPSQDLDYFSANLAGAEFDVELPFDRPRPATPSFRAGVRHRRLDPALAEALTEHARASGATAFMVAYAAYSVWLARYGNADVVVGTPFVDRSVPGSEDLVGLFLNTLPLRLTVDESEPFQELVKKSRDVVLGAMAHSRVSFEELAQRVRPARGAAHAPLVNVFIAYHARVVYPDFTGLEVGRLEVEPGGAKYDLAGSFLEDPEGLTFSIEFDPDRFDGSTADAMIDGFLFTLASLLASPDQPMQRLPTMAAEARASVDASWNKTASDTVAPNVVNSVLARCAEGPMNPCVIHGDDTITYAELALRAHALAARLRRDGIGAGAIVAVSLAPGIAPVVAALAIMATGAAYFPLDPALPLLRIAAAARAAGAAMIVTTSDRPAPDGVPILAIDDDDVTSTNFAMKPVLAPESLAYVIMTSGTSGEPKCVGITHGALANLVAWHLDRYRLGPADRMTQIANAGFDASVWETWPTLVAGATLAVVPDDVRATPTVLAEWMKNVRITQTFLPTPLYETVAESVLGVPGLREILVGGDRLVHRPPANAGPRLTNHYGPTECTVVATAADVESEGGTPTIGGPIRNIRAYVVDRYGRLAPHGAAGELWLAGTGLARGYLNGDSDARFVDVHGSQVPETRAYRTGDRVRRRGDALEFLGRIDSQLKIRGQRIEPLEIEAVIARHPRVRGAAVVPHETPAGLQLVAYVMAEEGVTSNDLRRFVAERLPAAAHPASIELVSDLPLTNRGKLDRKSLPPPAMHGAAAVSEAPATDTERKLAKLWSELLGEEDIGRDDDFFALGGHSLLAMRLAAKVHDAFSVHLPLPVVLQAPTIRGLADAIETLRGEPAPLSVRSAALRAQQTGSLSPDSPEPFPLTEVQEAYWLGRRDEITLGGVAAQAYVEIDVSAQLDIDALERALDHLARRHGMLRAVFAADGTQRILPRIPPITITRFDLRGLTAERKATRLASLRREFSHERRAVDRAPLLALRASAIDDQVTRLHASIDGLIADARSVSILIAELAQLLANPSAQLPPIALSFRDYVLAQRARNDEGARATALAYWKSRAPTLPDGPSLPLARSRGEDVFRRFAGELDREHWSRLKARAAAHKLSPTTVLLTAFAEVLARYADHAPFVVSVTRFAREPIHADVDRLVGDFTELALLEATGLDGRSFTEAAADLQKQWWMDLEHRAVSAVGVLREVARVRGVPFVPIPVAFTSLLDGEAPLDVPFGKIVHSITQTPQVLLDHQTAERNGALVFQWDAREHALAPGIVPEMQTLYRDLLVALATSDTAWSTPHGPAATRAAAPRAFAKDAKPPSAETLLDLVRPSFDVRADAPAVIAVDATLSYRELAQCAGAIATRLQSAGVRPGARVALIVEKGWAAIAGALGILWAGATYVPFEVELEGSPARIAGHDRIERALGRAAPSAVVTTPSLQAHVTGLPSLAKVRAVLVSQDLRSEPAAPPAASDPETPAYVMFTSGSTGVPKGVVVPHRAAAATIRDINDRFGVGPTDRVLQLSALGFDLSVYDLFGVLAAGGTVVCPDPKRPRDPAHWFDLLRAQRITLWNTVPTLLAMLLAYAEDKKEAGPTFASLRVALLSGDFTPLSLPDALRRIAPLTVLASLGGATEAGIWSVVHVVERVDPEWASIPYGRPLSGQAMTVLDEAMTERPALANGDLWIAGVGLAQGYLGDDVLTMERFVTHPETGERWYRTGDRGRRHRDGTLEILGREDDQVKIGGERIELGEIEAVLARHAKIAQVAVVAPGPREARRLVAHVVPRGALDEAELARFADEKLPRSYRPRRFILCESLPLGATGKLDRKKLVERSLVVPAAGSPPSRRAGAAPAASESIVEQVQSLVLEVLRLPSLAVDADLLASGADSLQLVRLGNRLEETFGHRPAMQELYGLRTIAALAEYYRARGDAPRAKAGTIVLARAEEREAFKRARHGVRKLGREAEAKSLGASPSFPPIVLLRRSARTFAPRPLALDDFGALLASASTQHEGATARYLYPSAGGLYSVQVYTHVKPNAVTGLAGGAYYLHPDKGLVPIRLGEALPDRVHSFDNARLFAAAGFSIFLVVDLDAIEPIYGELARDFALIEAGAMTQLLMMWATSRGIALCPIGNMDTAPVSAMLELGARRLVLLSLLGGPVDDLRTLTDAGPAGVEYEVVTL